MVRHGGQRHPALSRAIRNGRASLLERSTIHLQHGLLQLPREPALDKLRSENRHLSYGLAEPGINCETCHGPCEEHNRVCREAPREPFPRTSRSSRTNPLLLSNTTRTAGTCHAKMNPLTAGFTPGIGSSTITIWRRSKTLISTRWPGSG